jgi:hypothetical protein
MLARLTFPLLLALTCSLSTGGSPGLNAADPVKQPLAERLRKPIDVNFRRTPLKDSFATLGIATGVKFAIDGNSLKLVGYTQNMPVTMQHDKRPAIDIARLIMKPFPQLCLVLDDETAVATLTTRAGSTKLTGTVISASAEADSESGNSR